MDTHTSDRRGSLRKSNTTPTGLNYQVETRLRTHPQTLADANKEPPLELLHGEWHVGYLRLV